MSVAFAIALMVAIHFLFLDTFNKPNEPEAPAMIGQTHKATEDTDYVEIVVPSAENPYEKRAIKSSRVRQPYVYPLFSDTFPYDSRALDELKIHIPNIDGSLRSTPKKFNYALKNNSDKTARIAIIIDDVGMNRKQSKAAVAIENAPLTLAFLPYAPNLNRLTEPAIAAGHELIIHMPMEPLNSDVPLGSIALKDNMNADDARAMLGQAFESFDGYVGLNNHMGSKATQNHALMKVVMETLEDKNLFYVDSKTISSSIAADAARKQGLRFAERDVFIDHEDSLDYARNALKRAEKVALSKGHAIAIGHPKSNTLQALREWIPTLEARGFEIVPVSELLMVPREGAVQVSKLQDHSAQSKKTFAPPKSVPKFILNDVSASDEDFNAIKPTAGQESEVEVTDLKKSEAKVLNVDDNHAEKKSVANAKPEFVTEDLLSAPIGVSDDASGGLYLLSQ
ncbi:MAG: divergent polysaccharide deacetylase family protein [Bdellovibrionales bacterium]